MWAPGVPAWEDVAVLDRRTMPRPAFVARLVREAPRYDATVINGAARFHDLYQDLVAGVLLARRRRPPPIVVAETAWDTGSAPLSKRLGIEGFGLGGVTRLGVRAFDGDHVTYTVFSEEEGDLLSQTFGIPSSRIALTPFAHTLWSRADGPSDPRGYVFAGGNSLRDYETLCAAARGVDAEFRIATTQPV